MSHELVLGSYRSIASALAEEVRPRLRNGERVEVIVPTRSAAATLLLGLEDVLPTTHLEVHSIEGLAARIVNENGHFPRLATDHERELAMELACRSTSAELAATPGMTSMLLRSERDVRDSAIALADLRYRIRSSARLAVRDRLETIERIWSAAARTVADSGAATQPDVLVTASQSIRSGAPVPEQVIYGFYDATGLQMEILDALIDAGHVRAVYLPVPLDPSGSVPSSFVFARSFVERMRARAAGTHVLPADTTGPEWTVAAYGSPLLELHEVCRSVRTLLNDGVPASEVAIVARSVDARDANLLATMARRFGFSLRGLQGRRLSGNRIARGVACLLLLQRRGFLRRDVMEIIRSGARLPDVEGSIPSLDRLESATRKARISRGRRDTVLAAEKRARYREDEPDDTLLGYAEVVDSLDRLTSAFARSRDGAAWSHSLDSLVALFRPATDEDLDAIESLRELARALRRPGFATKRFDARTLSRLIEEAGPLPRRRPEEPAVWFGDAMRFRGLDVRHVFAVRMQHDLVPQRRVEDALLPDVDRRALGIRVVGDGRDEESLLFTLLTSGASTAVHFSFASSDSMGRTIRPSSLLKDFLIARRPDERLRILQDFEGWLALAPSPPTGATSNRELAVEQRIDEGRPELVRALQLVAMKGTGSPFDGRVTPDATFHDRLAKVLSRISPSRLEHLGECPQRFFVTSVLGLKETEDPEPNVQIEIRQKGLIDHEILEELYSGLSEEDWTSIESGEPSKLPPALVQRLGEIVARHFRTFDEEFPPLNETIRAIERDETESVLHQFAAADLAELARRSFRPVSFELLLDVEENDETRIPLGPIDAGIHGRIDRVDRHATDGVRVIDYKSGKAARMKKLESRIDDGLRLQLAIYALVVRRLQDLEPSAVSAAIRPLRVDSSEAETYEFGLAERYESLTSMLDLLGATIHQGRFPAVPYNDVCNYCVINSWCRTRVDPREAAHATRHGSAVRLLETEES